MFDSLKKNEFVRFVGVGGLNTGVTYGLFVLLQMALPYQVAYTLVYAFGIVFSYWLNSVFVFQRAMSLRKALQYPVVYGVQYVFGIVLLTVLVDGLSLSPVVAAPIAIVAAIPVTFVLSRTIIKGKTEQSS